jgi:hypothetical protein
VHDDDRADLARAKRGAVIGDARGDFRRSRISGD